MKSSAGDSGLRGEQFCYFHQRMHRGVRIPPQARLHPIANLEDEESIQSALMEVINALMRSSIDLKRATLILRALHIAVKNAARVKYNLHANNMVKEIPEFVEPSFESLELAHAMRVGDPPVPRVRTHAERVADGDYPPPPPQKRRSREEFLADYFGYPSVEAYRAAQAAEEKAKAEKQNVGTAALGCPGGAAAVSQPASQLPPHDFKTSAPKSEAPPREANDQRQATKNASPRKPPMTVKEEPRGATANPAPKARANSPHAARRA